MKELEFGEKLPGILKDPFEKGLIKGIRVHMFKLSYAGEGKWTAIGSVEFKNGNTEGEQKFKAETFNEVVQQIEVFLKTL